MAEVWGQCKPSGAWCCDLHRGAQRRLTSCPLPQETALQGTGAREEPPSRTPPTGHEGSSARLGTTASRVPHSRRAPCLSPSPLLAWGSEPCFPHSHSGAPNAYSGRLPTAHQPYPAILKTSPHRNPRKPLLEKVFPVPAVPPFPLLPQPIPTEKRPFQAWLFLPIWGPYQLDGKRPAAFCFPDPTLLSQAQVSVHSPTQLSFQWVKLTKKLWS